MLKCKCIKNGLGAYKSWGALNETKWDERIRNMKPLLMDGTSRCFWNYKIRVELKRIWTMKIRGGSFFKITPGLNPEKCLYKGVLR